MSASPEIFFSLRPWMKSMWSNNITLSAVCSVKRSDSQYRSLRHTTYYRTCDVSRLSRRSEICCQGNSLKQRAAEAECLVQTMQKKSWSMVYNAAVRSRRDRRTIFFIWNCVNNVQVDLSNGCSSGKSLSIRRLNIWHKIMSIQMVCEFSMNDSFQHLGKKWKIGNRTIIWHQCFVQSSFLIEIIAWR